MNTSLKSALTVVLAAMIAQAMAAEEGGSLLFRNWLPFPEVVGTPFFNEEGILLGEDYVAQLYVWKAGEGWSRLCRPVPFNEGGALADGYFWGGELGIPFTFQSSSVWVQVRAWEAAGGATFEEATLAGAWSGTSEVLFVHWLGHLTELCPSHGMTVSRSSSEASRRPLAPPHVPAELWGLTYPGPPLVVRQPAGRTARVRERVELSVVASSGVRASYQWHQEPSDAPYGLILDATNATYRTPPLLSTTTYWVTIRNSAGATTSERAVVTVEGPSSTPRLKPPRFYGGKVSVYLEGEPGVEYEVQYRDRADAGSWIPLTRVVGKAPGITVRIKDGGVAGVPHRFYRAVVVP